MRTPSCCRAALSPCASATVSLSPLWTITRPSPSAASIAEFWGGADGGVTLFSGNWPRPPYFQEKVAFTSPSHREKFETEAAWTQKLRSPDPKLSEDSQNLATGFYSTSFFVRYLFFLASRTAAGSFCATRYYKNIRSFIAAIHVRCILLSEKAI
jgi:hypothetical protein